MKITLGFSTNLIFFSFLENHVHFFIGKLIHVPYGKLQNIEKLKIKLPLILLLLVLWYIFFNFLISI